MFLPPLPVSCGIIAVSSAISSLFSIPAPCWIANQQSPSWIIHPNLMLFSVQLPSEGVRNCISSNIMTMGMNNWIQQAIYKLRIHPEFTLSNIFGYKYKVLGRPIMLEQMFPISPWSSLATLHGLTKDFYLNPFLRAVVKKKTVFFVLKLRDCTVYFHKVYNKPILVQVCVDLYASNLKQLLSHPSYAVENYLLVVEYCSNCSVFDIFGFFCNLIKTNWSQSNNFEQLGFLLP